MALRDLRRRHWITIGAVVLFLLIHYLARPWAPRTSRAAFREVICSPVPRSVAKLRGSFGRTDKTISYELAFSASANDVQQIIATKPFVAMDRQVLVTNDLAWFQPESIGSRGMFLLYAESNRKDILWIDETGTNCLYLYQVSR